MVGLQPLGLGHDCGPQRDRDRELDHTPARSRQLCPPPLGNTAASASVTRTFRAAQQYRPGMPDQPLPMATTDSYGPSLYARSPERCPYSRSGYGLPVVADADADLRVLITRTAPGLLALPGVGTETAGQLLVTVGDNPDRLATEASFAHLCAAAPAPASSGRTDRHRLNRGGDRQANRALHTIMLVRMRHDPRTRDHVARRTLEGLKTKDIFRYLTRFVA